MKKIVLLAAGIAAVTACEKHPIEHLHILESKGGKPPAGHVTHDAHPAPAHGAPAHADHAAPAAAPKADAHH